MTLFMMQIILQMLVSGQFVEVATITVKNFPNAAACESHRAYVTYSLPSQYGVHNAVVTCVPQP